MERCCWFGKNFRNNLIQKNPNYAFNLSANNDSIKRNHTRNRHNDKFYRPGSYHNHGRWFDNGVNIFFQGHDHLFAHEVMDGVHYQTVPMPSDSTYMIGKLANADAFVSDTLDGTGHVRVTVDPSCVSVDYVKAYLPKDTLGTQKNRAIGFHYNVGCTITGIEEWNEEQEAGAVIVYPNPVEQKLYLRFKEEPREWEASMFSITGEKWHTSNKNEWDVSGIPNGSYLIVIQSGGWKVVKKIIIQH